MTIQIPYLASVRGILRHRTPKAPDTETRSPSSSSSRGETKRSQSYEHFNIEIWMRSSAGWPPRPLSKRPVDAAYEPTHDDHQVSGTFLNESPDVDQETKHRILDGSQKRITLYWRRCNIYEDPNVGRYSYKMDFVIIRATQDFTLSSLLPHPVLPHPDLLLS